MCVRYKHVRWAVASVTGVGYGDIVPQTPWGKFFAGISSFLGIGLLSICAGKCVCVCVCIVLHCILL